jgi:hypothetical protein
MTGEDRKENGTARKGLSERDSLNGTNRTGLIGQDSQSRTAREQNIEFSRQQSASR